VKDFHTGKTNLKWNWTGHTLRKEAGAILHWIGNLRDTEEEVGQKECGKGQ
jgi:hypothetical protein